MRLYSLIIFQILHFDCMRFGQDSIAFLKPEENGGLTGAEAEGDGGGDAGSMVVYDYVELNKIENSTKKP